MSQESLDFGFLHRINEAADLIYEHLDLIAKTPGIGMAKAAAVCGIDRGDLRRALDRDGRRVGVEHAMTLAAISGYQQRRAVVEVFARALGFEIADQREPMTPVEENARMKGAFAALGPLGMEAMRLALSTP